MLLDSTLMFDGPGFVAVTATRPSTNTIDTGGPIGLGQGERLNVFATTNGAFVGAGTLQVALESSADNTTWITQALSPAMNAATLNSRTVGGQPFLMSMDWPSRPPGSPIPRYHRLTYTVAGGNFTAGALQAYMNLGNDENQAYPRSALSNTNI